MCIRDSSQDEPYMDMIHQMSLTGESIISPMGTHLSTVSWNDILILGAQLNPSPLDAHADVTLTTVIGKHACLLYTSKLSINLRKQSIVFSNMCLIPLNWYGRHMDKLHNH